MGWRPNLTPEQRASLNATRRRMYARKRMAQGLPYNPKLPLFAPEQEKEEGPAIRIDKDKLQRYYEGGDED